MTSEQKKIAIGNGKINRKSFGENEYKYFKSIFDKYDTDGNGAINAQELISKLKEDNVEISEKVIQKLIKYSDKNGDGNIQLDEFIDMVLNKDYKILFGQYARSYIDFIVPKKKSNNEYEAVSRFNSLQNTAEVDGISQCETEECWPPPFFMITISVFELIFFVINLYIRSDDDATLYEYEYGKIADFLMYSPRKRKECWRLITYMFVHLSWNHLIVNLLIQLVLGIALEYRNKSRKVLTVYFAGIIAGSLFTSIMDPTVYLGGASAGVYALLTAHLSDIIINWNEVPVAYIQFFAFLLIITVDLGYAIYIRYNNIHTHIGYAAHFGGAIAGFLVGIWILTNKKPTEKEKYLYWIAIFIYFFLMILSIILNIFWKSHFSMAN